MDLRRGAVAVVVGCLGAAVALARSAGHDADVVAPHHRESAGVVLLTNGTHVPQLPPIWLPVEGAGTASVSGRGVVLDAARRLVRSAEQSVPRERLVEGACTVDDLVKAGASLEAAVTYVAQQGRTPLAYRLQVSSLVKDLQAARSGGDVARLLAREYVCLAGS
jgi:hypothetical protein